jgi:hypothetical protein
VGDRRCIQPPVANIYITNIIADHKRTKMLFISTEKSKQEEVTNIFKKIYDGTLKE